MKISRRGQLKLCLGILFLLSVVVLFKHFHDCKQNDQTSFAVCSITDPLCKQLFDDLTFVIKSIHKHWPYNSETQNLTKILFQHVFAINSNLTVILQKIQNPQIKQTVVPITSTSTPTYSSTSPVICPDRYIHANLSEPLFLNGSWVKERCNTEKPVQSLLTVILKPETNDKDCDLMQKLTQQIWDIYPKLKIIIGIDNKNCRWQNDFYVSVMQTSKSDSPGRIWNKLVKSVATPYALIGRGMEMFSWFTNVERQLAVLSGVPNVSIVGGSYRNRTGHWEMGCYQSSLKLYQLIYEDGYHASRNECVFCDHLMGPFILNTKQLKHIKFNRKIPEAILFEDFFLRLKKYGRRTMNCPDAMYFATDKFANERRDDRTHWLALVKNIELNRVQLPDGIRHKFTCEESGSSCKNLYSRVGRRFMPVCCMDNYVNGLKVLRDFCLKNNLTFYVTAGTLLGAVKFRNIIPWDFDGDIYYYLANEKIFENADGKFGDGKNIFLGDIHKKWFGYMRIFTPQLFIEMNGLNETAIEKSGMPELFRKVPTLVRIRDEWFPGPPSPGLSVRNEYGREIFKHANSWWSQGHLWFDPYKTQEKFYKCDSPGHHACYDKFPTDGSFNFIVP